MNFEKALKAFRRMGYKYGEAAKGIIISANVGQQEIVVRQAVSIMQGGTAVCNYDGEARRLYMGEDGAVLAFRTVYDVLNDLLSGYAIPYIGITQLAQIEGGLSAEHKLRAMLRSPSIPATDRLYLTLENI